jgi:hypothetical protein
MNKIKVIEGMEPWEVMKAASEGKRVAGIGDDGKYSPCTGVIGWNWYGRPDTYAIIDDSQPELTAEWWEGFDDRMDKLERDFAELKEYADAFPRKG